MLSVPYATTAELAEYDPVFTDLLNLAGGDPVLAAHAPVLTRAMMAASEWCDRECLGEGGTLTAHTRTETKRLRPDRQGRLLFHPDHIPLIKLTAVAYGRQLGSLTTVTNPTVVIEDARTAIVELTGGNTAWSGSLHLGASPASGELITTWTYTAGYPNTLLTSVAAIGATSITVSDVTGIQPGQRLLVTDPVMEETVTVATGWVPATGPGTLPLAAGLVAPHSAPVTGMIRVTAVPRPVTEAAINHAMVYVLRPGVLPTGTEGAVPDDPGDKPTEENSVDRWVSRLTQRRLDRAALIAEAGRLLGPYRRVF